MTFLSKFCDTIFFYHANPLTVILSSKCCMMFLVMVFSGNIITLFSMFTNPQRKSFLATTEPLGEHLKVLCCSASSPVPFGASGIKRFLLLTFDHSAACFLLSHSLFLSLTFDICCHNAVINTLPVFLKSGTLICQSHFLTSSFTFSFIRWQKSCRNLGLHCNFAV